MSEPESSRCEHLFISYADEDWALAEWVTLRVTAEGYRSWCARFPMLGGELYPRHAGAAIVRRSFCVIQLLSTAALANPAVIEARTRALETAVARQREFLILLNVDGLNPLALEWATPDLTFIPFHERWETGLARLLTKLSSMDAPRPLPDGRRVAAEARQFMTSRRSWHTVL